MTVVVNCVFFFFFLIRLRVLFCQIMSGGGGQFIGINSNPHQQRGGGSGDGTLSLGGQVSGGGGSVFSTGSGGYSYVMQPLGGDGREAGPINRVSELEG